MGTSTAYMMEFKDLEAEADSVKVHILKQLVLDGLLGENEAERWSSENTLVITKKGFFRTISDRWRNTEEHKDGYFYHVVRINKGS